MNALIVRASDRQALLDEACRIAVEKGGFRLAAIGLVDARAAMRQVAAAGEGSAERDLARLKLGTRSLIWNDAQSGSFVALPLLVGGEAAGILLLYARQRDFFDEDEMRLLHELAGDIAFALHHLAQKARMDYLAYHDSLTDLPNRSLFTDRMSQALNAARREKRFAAAIFVDVERFRMVNETFGRKAGDDLLREIGERLREAAREQDTVARVGADHFAIAVAPFDRPGDTAYAFLERLDQAFARADRDRRRRAARRAQGRHRGVPDRRRVDRGAVRERRDRAEQGEAHRQPLPLLRAGDERARRRVARDGAPPAPRARGRHAGAALPAEDRHGAAARSPASRR